MLRFFPSGLSQLDDDAKCNTKAVAAFGTVLVFEVVNQDIIEEVLIAKLSDID